MHRSEYGALNKFLVSMTRSPIAKYLFLTSKIIPKKSPYFNTIQKILSKIHNMHSQFCPQTTDRYYKTVYRLVQSGC